MAHESARELTGALNDRGVDDALALIRLLAEDVGPRRPTSAAERLAAQLLRDRLAKAGPQPAIEPFDGYSTFAAPYGLIGLLATAPALMPARWRAARSVPAIAAALGVATEGGLRHTPISRYLSRRPSQNLVAEIEPAGTPTRTVCLLAHLDTSRSGLMFHPEIVRYLSRFLALQSLAVMAGAGEPLLARTRAGRAFLGAARAFVLGGLAVGAERELLGEDVPGANDNASGVAVTAVLAQEVARRPLARTRVVLLATGCEESGLLGMQAFLRAHDTTGWLFLNFDNVGGPATLRYVESEGLVRRWAADADLVRLAERTATERPELGLEPAGEPIGLTYDATAVLARRGRALTFVAGDNGTIPNYHWPTDTPENLDRRNITQALETGRAMLQAIDRGDADRTG